MTIKVYTSGICGSQEVRKHQQRVLFILQSLPIKLQIIDVTEPGKDDDLIFMQETAKKHDKKTQLPPQIFNDNEYCGDYADFELANDDDEIMKFLKLESGPSKAEMLKNGGSSDAITQNGVGSHEDDKEVSGTTELSTNAVDQVESNTEQNEILNTEENVTAEVEKSVANENETLPDTGDKEKVSSEEESEESD